MRTTLTLDKDVVIQLRRQMRRSGATLKAAVNHFLRLGLTTLEKPQQKRFVVRARPLGLPPGLSYDNVAELIEALEGPAHK